MKQECGILYGCYFNEVQTYGCKLDGIFMNGADMGNKFYACKRREFYYCRVI